MRDTIVRNNGNYILFSILQSVICGTQINDFDNRCFFDDTLLELLNISKEHDIAHLIGLGLIDNHLVGQESEYFEKVQQLPMMAVYRHEKMNYEIKRLCETLEKAKIPFIPLKGSVIRKYYPEPWMRTSGDIDILVHEQDLRRAVSYLVDELGYIEQDMGSHDISLCSPSGVHLELHYQLIEQGWANFSNQILNKVWEFVSPKEGYTYWCEMWDDMFYFYHIAHMAKHFEQGGCGIKPYIDLWVLDQIKGNDQAKRDALLADGRLLKFAQVARRLSKVWLENAPLDAVTAGMQGYILRGGVQGNSENRIAIQQQQKGGNMRYLISKIFIPYEVIKFHYPILQKHRWLTPIMEVRRWGKLIFCGHAKRVVKELQYGQNVSKAEANDMRQFLNEIGL